MRKIKSNIPIFDYLSEIVNSYQNYYAIHFYTSKLNNRNKNEFQIKIAHNILEDLLINTKNKIFHLANDDFLIITESSNKNLIEKLIYQLRYLFIDDPIAFKKNKVPNPDFCRVFVLAFHYHEFVERYSKEDNLIAVNKTKADTTSLKLSNSFVTVEQDLTKLEIKNFIRKQNITLISKTTTTTVFKEIYINYLVLKTALKYDNEFLNNRTLFKFLVENIDMLLVEEITNNASNYFNQPINLNFNIETILSENFSNLAKIISSFLNSSIIIDIDFADAFADLASYHYAINFLKELGCKVCLDGVDAYSINHINRDLLGVDLVKLRWDNNIDNIIETHLLKSQILKWNPNRVILTHCHSADAVEYGNKLGIVLFQGLYIEKFTSSADL